MTAPNASASGTFDIPGVGSVNRLGYGAMRITGDGIWGEPASRETAREVVRRAVELGVNFIDTADSYGPDVSEEIIAEALHPYAEDLVIATKAGLTRTGANHAQVALAWILQSSPVNLPIPGTGSIAHLEDNLGGAGLTLTNADLAELTNSA